MSRAGPCSDRTQNWVSFDGWERMEEGLGIDLFMGCPRVKSQVEGAVEGHWSPRIPMKKAIQGLSGWGPVVSHPDHNIMHGPFLSYSKLQLSYTVLYLTEMGDPSPGLKVILRDICDTRRLSSSQLPAQHAKHEAVFTLLLSFSNRLKRHKHKTWVES